MINTTLKRLNSIRDTMLDISEGNAGLEAHISVEAEDETAIIASAFNQFVEKIKHMIEQVVNVSEQLSISSPFLPCPGHEPDQSTIWPAA